MDSRLPLVFSAEYARILGYTRGQIAHRLTSGRWVRVRRGLYTECEQAARFGRSPGEMHVLDVYAALQAFPSAVAGLWSAGLLHALPGRPMPLTTVQLVAPSGSPRRRGGVALDVAPLPPEHVAADPVLRTTTVARTIADIARRSDFVDAIPAADAAIARALVTKDELRAVLTRQAGWPGSIRAADVVEFADPRAESPLESRSRARLYTVGLPPADLQAEIRDEAGAFIARVDFLWAKLGVVGEADGRAKYAKGAADVLWREKQREDAIRRLGWEVVRWTFWEIDNDLRAVVERFWRAVDLAASRRRDGVVRQPALPYALKA